jgi:hypothetical protein
VEAVLESELDPASGPGLEGSGPRSSVVFKSFVVFKRK